jgi:hypothetical protein
MYSIPLFNIQDLWWVPTWQPTSGACQFPPPTTEHPQLIQTTASWPLSWYTCWGRRQPRRTVPGGRPPAFVPCPLRWASRTWRYSPDTGIFCLAFKNTRFLYNRKLPVDMIWYFIVRGLDPIKNVTSFHSLTTKQKAVLRIREILVRILMRIRILGSVPLTNGSGCGSGSVPKYSVT